MTPRPIGVSDLQSSPLAYGCWRIADHGDPGAGRAALLAAFEAGYTLFDNAGIYGGGACEEILGRTLKEVPGMREKIVILTKCGVRRPGEPDASSPQRYDLSAEHILASCEGSLRRLQVETLDIYMLHRADYLLNPEEVARAFSQLKAQGKVRHFGLSNFRPTLMTAVQAACPMPIVTHQFEFSLTRLDPLTDGTLDQCLIERVTPLAWSPLGGGLLADGAARLLAWQQGYQTDAIKPVLDDIARAHGISRAAVALAWLMKHPAQVVPIVGSTKPERIREAVKAANLEMSREEWYRLLLAARGAPLD